MSKHDEAIVIYFFELCAYSVPNVSNNFQT